MPSTATGKVAALRLPLVFDPGSRGGIFNTYYWLDPVQRVTGSSMTQILPLADQRVLQLYGQFESGVYNAVKAA
jgi:hypothetical protein